MISRTLVLSTATLIALAASAAQAASHHHVRHYYGAHAYRGYGPLNAGGPNSPGPIYRQGHYLGTDPDPNVRFEITRDPYFERR
jgi:hypothetical protein